MPKNSLTPLKSEDKMQKYSLGIDIGGSHITCQLYNLKDHVLVNDSKVRMSVDGNASKEEILDDWAAAIRESISKIQLSELAGIGFAMPGPFDYENGIGLFDENVDKFSRLHGVHVKKEITNRLKLPLSVPIRFVNDAAAFAMGEAGAEAVSGFSRILVLTLGTGLGSTFIENGKPVAGRYGIPDDGFLYHVPFNSGIADEYFSTRWFLGEYQKSTGKTITGVKQLAKDYKTDPAVQTLFQRFGANLGEFLLPWIRNFSAECIILGGNISKSRALFLPSTEEIFRKVETDVTIFPSSLDENAAIIGSARLLENELS